LTKKFTAEKEGIQRENDSQLQKTKAEMQAKTDEEIRILQGSHDTKKRDLTAKFDAEIKAIQQKNDADKVCNAQLCTE
jgi:hypothetical protein